MKDKAIILAGDHNGVELKQYLIHYLSNHGYHCIDLGPLKSDGKVDYPDYAYKAAQMINRGEVQKAILICGTGQGCSMVANKFTNVRASLVHNIKSAAFAREHNDANILCLGSWITDLSETEKIVSTWLTTPFGEGRHVPRVQKIKKFDYS